MAVPMHTPPSCPPRSMNKFACGLWPCTPMLWKKVQYQYFFVIDVAIASGKNRFFVYDYPSDVIIHQTLVTRGRCNEMALKGRRYNNVVGGGCSSLGRYKIGAKYYGNFGLAYILHGLDTSNSNPLERYVFLHSHDCVPKAPVQPYPFCQSDGCP